MLRAFSVLLFAFAISFVTPPVNAQQGHKPARIGTLMGGTVATHGKFVDWFRQGMTELGYKEGRDYVLVSRWGMGNFDLPPLAEEIVRENVDVILVVGRPVIRSIKKATKEIPVVVGSAGSFNQFASSLARPGGNITGVTYDSRALYTKRLGLLTDALPQVRRVAFLYFFPGRRAGSQLSQQARNRLGRDLKRVKAAGTALGVQIQPLHAPTLADVEKAFVSMEAKKAEAVIISNEGFSVLHQKRLAALAVAKKIPSLCDQASFAHAGCLMSYTPDRERMLRRAATFVDRILKGAKPADLPVEISTRYKFVVNKKTAKAIGFTLSPSILLQATEVIE